MKVATDRLTGTDWQRLVIAAADVIDGHVDELSGLDAAVGDGDHGINVATALGHARREVAQLDDPTPMIVLSVAAGSFFEEMAGAAGALFGSFFRSFALSFAGCSAIGTAQLADAIEAGTEMVARRGKAHAGDKTMMDALVPAAEAGRAAAIADIPIAAALGATAVAARRGATSTTMMAASLGRARYAEDKSVGVQDPGATTVALIFEAWAAAAGAEGEGDCEPL
ncbi:PTS-dependent dihydroxyacetone kinase, ADP-binding subunit DhaL [bacterium BMS3Abin02]|nr:PTS-dependent dihydroxyacetone kinase, ADP-binding subunit DhaL [bacterium BMS3Abin02]GBE20879.1 PTS-dependent dihydroxyacetone kinase, ADP-binding subunit DhaL [bacterium BMS3Bbin01]